MLIYITLDNSGLSIPSFAANTTTTAITCTTTTTSATVAGATTVATTTTTAAATIAGATAAILHLLVSIAINSVNVAVHYLASDLF